MKVTYDKEVDALYIQLRRGKVHKTSEKEGNIFVDFDKKGMAVGVEVLRFSKSLPKTQKLEIAAGERRLPIPA